MTWVIFLIALIPLMESLTANQMMDIYRARQKMIEMRNPETQWRKSIIDNSPPIGFVAGEPIHSRVWERVRPGEPIFVDENGVPYEYRRRG